MESKSFGLLSKYIWGPFYKYLLSFRHCVESLNRINDPLVIKGALHHMLFKHLAMLVSSYNDLFRTHIFTSNLLIPSQGLALWSKCNLLNPILIKFEWIHFGQVSLLCWMSNSKCHGTCWMYDLQIQAGSWRCTNFTELI